MPEFGSHHLETFRQPLEDKVVTISRAQGSLSFPANSMLVGAMNPGPCGSYGENQHECTCNTPVPRLRLGTGAGVGPGEIREFCPIDDAGHLPNNLTVAKIRAGNSIIRNPILVSFIAKGLLPYRGLGSGIKRALDDWPEIEFVDDREANLFTSTVHRKELSDAETEGAGKKTPGKTPDKILVLLREDPRLAIPDLAASIGKSESAVERAIRRLREQNRLRRVGPDKGGHWEVIE